MSEENKTEQPSASAPMEQFLAALEDLSRKAREHISSPYANGVNFELNEMDIRILFGQLIQSPRHRVDWHTAVTMAWPEAKLFSYFLRVNLAIYESNHETIKLPASMLPATITAPGDLETNPESRKLFEAIQAIRTELMKEQMPLHSKPPVEEKP